MTEEGGAIESLVSKFWRMEEVLLSTNVIHHLLCWLGKVQGIQELKRERSV